MAKVLIVLTSHTQLGDTGRRTGFYFDEMATPYWAMTDAGHEVTIASIRGGRPDHDPSSVKDNPSERPAPVQRFIEDARAMAKLANTPAVDQLVAADYAAIFLPGGHGTMFDFAQSKELGALVGKIYDQGGTIGAVCHGPAGLVGALRSDGKPVVAGLKVNSFTDAEEAAVGLTDTMPFLLESRLRALGAKWEGGANFQEYAVRDGQLVTGQNPASAAAVALKMVEAMAERPELTTI